MSFGPNSGFGMGRSNREQDSPEEILSVDQSNDVPLDLSMPRYSNRVPKVPRARNSYFGSRGKNGTSSYDVDSSDQPIDYSKKYVESNTKSTIKSNYVPRNSLVVNKPKTDQRGRQKNFSQRDCKGDHFGDYAETDLDQPTDYSLRYAEDDTDDEDQENSTYFASNEQEDAIKTYCTEGTPCETPLNFSEATSMSDLRLEDTKEVAKNVANQDICNNNNINDNENAAEDSTQVFNDKNEEDIVLTKDSKNFNNELVLNSSGTFMDKSGNYYEKSTLGRISRDNSMTSFDHSIDAQNEEVEGASEEQNQIQMMTPALSISPICSVNDSREEPKDNEEAAVNGDSATEKEAATCGLEEDEKDTDRGVGVDKEGKVVTFGGEDHYAEETPLMFSRSSSLGSLSGFEQHSIHDDRSSIVSDFSRLTSGVVSPSELPDSPTHTVPPSPRHNHRLQSTDLPTRGRPLRNFFHVKSPRPRSSVFEDNIAAFKEESTPIEFSAATSLSSLTIDDEPKITMDSKNTIDSEKSYSENARKLDDFSADSSVEISDDKSNEIINEASQSPRDCDNYRVHASDDDVDYDDILADCICRGIRRATSKEPSEEVLEFIRHDLAQGKPYKVKTNLVRYQTSSTLDRLDESSSPGSQVKTSDAVTVPSDTLRVYCTEDTPANITPVGSQSNISELSRFIISGDFRKDKKILLSGDEEDDKILEQAIQAGIPKLRHQNTLVSDTAAAPVFLSPRHLSTKSHLKLPTSTAVRKVSSSSLPIAKAEIPIAPKSCANRRSEFIDREDEKVDQISTQCIPKPQHQNTSLSNTPPTAYVPKYPSIPDSKLPVATADRKISSSSSSLTIEKDERPNRETLVNRCPAKFVEGEDEEDDKIVQKLILAGMARKRGSNTAPTNTSAAPAAYVPKYLSMNTDPKVAVTTADLKVSSSSIPIEKEELCVNRETPGNRQSSANFVEGEDEEDDKTVQKLILAGMARKRGQNNALTNAASAPVVYVPKYLSMNSDPKLSTTTADRKLSSSSSSLPIEKDELSINRETSVNRHSSAKFVEGEDDEDDKTVQQLILAGMARKRCQNTSLTNNSAAQATYVPKYLSIKPDSKMPITTADRKVSASFSSLPIEKEELFINRESSGNRCSPAKFVEGEDEEDDKIVQRLILAGMARKRGSNTSLSNTPATPAAYVPKFLSMQTNPKLPIATSDRKMSSSSSSLPTGKDENFINREYSGNRPAPAKFVEREDEEDDKMVQKLILAGMARKRGQNTSLSNAAAAPVSYVPKYLSMKSNLESPVSTAVRKVSSAFSSLSIEQNELPLNRERLGNWRPRSESDERDDEHEYKEPAGASAIRRAPSMHSYSGEILYDDNMNSSEDDAISTASIHLAMPKGRLQNPLPFVNSQISKRTPETSTLRSSVNEAASFTSSHIEKEVFHGSVTRITISHTNEADEHFIHNSSVSEDEEDSNLARDVKSGMTRASDIPPRIMNVNRDNRSFNK